MNSWFLVALLKQPMTDKLYFGAKRRVNYQPNFLSMRTYLLKSLGLCALGLALSLPNHATAQMLVGPGGLPPQPFTAAPPVSQWATTNVTPNSPSAITTPAELDASVLTNTAARVNGAIVANGTVPPALGAVAQWNSNGRYLQSRANGNQYTLIKATLRNNSGANLSNITIAYDLDVLVAPGSSANEDIPGFRVYYSLTGNAGSWVHIPGLDSPSADFSGPMSATINVGTWAPNANLYLLWADDNGPTSSSAPNHEGGYTIDNFSISFQLPNIFTHPQSQIVTPGLPATLSVVAGGAAPLSYQWQLNSNNIANATNSSYSIAAAQVSDQGFYRVVVGNAFGSTNSSNAFLSVSCASPVVITNQPQDRSIGLGDIIDLRVGVSGSAPIQYQWYRNDVPISGATNFFYQRGNAGLADTGIYYVRVTNCGGTVQSEDAIVSVSADPIPIVGSAHVWRYNQQNVDLGSAWIAPTYNDATWQSGPGILGFAVGENTLGGTIRTVLNRFGPAPNTSQIRTYYFRTSFVFSNDPAQVRIFVTNRIDDGVILYLNGVELRRLSMGGAANWQTLATRANDISEAAHGIEVFEVDSFLLNQGTNYLAGELHQGSADSSDVVFGVEIWAVPPAPSFLDIVNQPRDLTLEETKDAHFTVNVSGGAPVYQWFEQGVGPIAGANRPTLTIPNITMADSGFYYVVASNFINTVTSRVARLTVIADTNAPTVVGADGTLNFTNIIVSFGERVALTDATNRNNYQVTNTVTGVALTINSAVLTNATNVILGTSARTPGQNYILTALNIHDTAPLSNLMAVGSYPVSQRLELIPLSGGNFRFYDPFQVFEGVGDDPNIGTTWMNPGNTNYTVAPWGNGSPIFYVGLDESEVPGSVGSSLSQSYATISYFRTGLPGNISPGGLDLTMRYIVDDGAVFYLNGKEFHRVRMPDGPALYNTLASAPGSTSISDPITIPGTAWLSGTNVFAASLHQIGPNVLPKAFAVEIVATIQSMILGPVIIVGQPQNQTVPENLPVTFTVVQSGGATFQWRSNNVNIAGATNAAYTIPAVKFSMNSNLYSVVVSSPTGGTRTSSNAVLRVIADTNAPALVSGFITASNTVLVSYSEVVASPSATTVSNYRITNSAGANISISAAILSNGTNVILNVGALPGSNHVLVVNNVRDIALVPNTISPNPSLVRLGFLEGALISIGGTWRYNDTGTDLGTAWRNVGYNEAGWGTGEALLGEEGTVFAEPLRTELNYVAGKITYYFRTTFNSPIAPSSARLRIRTIIDDGAVFYLNGVEVQRVRLTGTVTAATLAAGTPAEGAFEIYEITVTNLVAGANLLAVEVHQSSATSTDIVFGSELTFLGLPSVIIDPPQQVPVQITAQPQSRTNAVGTAASFSVTASGDPTLRYQWRFNGNNISSGLNPTATNSMLVLNNVQLNQAGNYSVTVSNSFSGAVSATAILTVTNVVGPCTPVTWTNSLRFTNDLRASIAQTNGGTRVVLQWLNPATNSCGSNAVVVLQRALTLGDAFPVPSTLWTNIYTNVFGVASVTNTVPGASQAYYRLRVQ
jgi:hypothetical protein